MVGTTYIKIINKFVNLESNSYATAQIQASAVVCSFITGLSSQEASIKSATTRIVFFGEELESETSIQATGIISSRLIVAEFAKAEETCDMQQLNFQPVIYISYKLVPINIS